MQLDWRDAFGWEIYISINNNLLEYALMGLQSEQNNLKLAQKLMLYSAMENGASLLKLLVGMPWPPARGFNALEPYNPQTDYKQIGTPAFFFFFLRFHFYILFIKRW